MSLNGFNRETARRCGRHVRYDGRQMRFVRNNRNSHGAAAISVRYVRAGVGEIGGGWEEGVCVCVCVWAARGEVVDDLTAMTSDGSRKSIMHANACKSRG